MHAVQVNEDHEHIQIMQISPMGVVDMISPRNDRTEPMLGFDIFNNVSCFLHMCSVTRWVLYPLQTAGNVLMLQTNFDTYAFD